jgi:hypothetical protein
MSQERKRRIMLPLVLVFGLAGGLYLSLDLPPEERAAGWLAFGLAGVGGAAVGALLGAAERPAGRSRLAGLIEAPAVQTGAIALGVAGSVIAVRTFDETASMALLGACTGAVLALVVAAILRER